ncbi:MAG: hypothetical protein HY832_02525, partial [Candidatus Aenigmarchaeota archaeon]|nr:hypothetical protein [Candidatus Aenigmarchaeota archaeon]
MPASVAPVGYVYTFTPNAGDQDGDQLVFSISNKPAWAIFNASSGVLGGTAGPGDVGTWANIVISVSDGSLSTALPAFNIIVVSPGGDGSAAVIWQPSDGLVGERIFALAIDHGNSQNVYAGSYGGGVFKSTNGGRSWGAVNVGLNNTSVYALAIDPGNSQIIYA